ncbi:hypothetical protein V8C86DRAFT_3035840 [Haematococcus lacustris]
MPPATSSSSTNPEEAKGSRGRLFGRWAKGKSSDSCSDHPSSISTAPLHTCRHNMRSHELGMALGTAFSTMIACVLGSLKSKWSHCVRWAIAARWEGEGEEEELEEEDGGEEGEGAEEEDEGEEEGEGEKQKQEPAKKRSRKGRKQVPDEFSKIVHARFRDHAPNADKPFSVLGKYEQHAVSLWGKFAPKYIRMWCPRSVGQYTIPGCAPGEYPKLGSNSVEARWNVPMRAIIGLICKEFTKANPPYLDLLSYWMLLAAFKKTWKLVAAKYPQPGSPKLLKWDKYFAYFNNHFKGIQETSPPKGLKPFASLWDIYKQGDEWAWLTSCQQAFKPQQQPQQQVCSSPLPRPLSPNQPQQQPAPAAGVQQHPAPTPIQQPASAAVVRQPPATPTAGEAGLKAPTTGLGTALPAAAGGQYQHNPPVQNHGQARRVQWPQALIQYLIQKVDTVQNSVNRLEDELMGRRRLHVLANTALTGSGQSGEQGHSAAAFDFLKIFFLKNMFYFLQTTIYQHFSPIGQGDVYQPHELEQCRLAALAHGLTIFQLPQLAIDMAAVVAASILITRVYNHMVFSSVNANSKTQYGTGQRVQDGTGLASMNAPWRDVCCGFCVAKTVVPCDMATQINTEAIVGRTWKLVAAKYPQPGSPKLLKWDKYFAYFNNHFKGIQETSPPEGLKPFASLWDIYKQAPAAASPSSKCAAAPCPGPCPPASHNSSQPQQQQQEGSISTIRQCRTMARHAECSGHRWAPAPRRQAQQQDELMGRRRLHVLANTALTGSGQSGEQESTGGTLLHGGAVRFPKNTQLAIDMAAVVAASILITRVYNHMVFSSVNANSKTQYGTGQRVQVVLAKSDKNSSGDLDTTLKLLSDKYNAAVYSALTAEKKKEVDEAKIVLTQYLTLLQPVLKQLLGRPLNALATIITDPTWQRCLNRKGELVATLAKQLAQAQAPHTDFLPVGPGMDDGLVFLLALKDFPPVAYMGSHKLSQLAAAHCWRTADGEKQVVEVEDMDALALTLPHQLGTEVLVKAGQLVLFRGNTVHAGNVGVAGSCCAKLYGFGRPDTVADNTTMNTSELGDLYHGLFQPIQDEGIGPKMADWNRRGMAGQWDPVVRCQDPVVWCQDPVVRCQDPVVWCQDPVVWCQDPVSQDPVVWCQDPDPKCQDPEVRSQDPVVRFQDPVGQDPVAWCQDPVGQDLVVCARTLWTLWCQNPVVRCQDHVVWCQDPVSQDPVVRYLDPVEKDTHRRTLYRVLAQIVNNI